MYIFDDVYVNVAWVFFTKNALYFVEPASASEATAKANKLFTELSTISAVEIPPPREAFLSELPVPPLRYNFISLDTIGIFLYF
ncbi:MAG: hypothetical protein COZ25_07415 [Ignavibacteria bacterium CG_4_10_14_3_um_filter_37_18]|nr:MAG: hypothetical protein COZ25_07415 [Ignavibacteria bacterium CG_4_10_14_3_um_filter_37_18]